MDGENNISINRPDWSENITRYLSEFIALASKFFGLKNIISGILFGSHTKNDVIPISDCDLLLVVDNSIERKEIDRYRPLFNALGIKHGLRKQPTNIIDKILTHIENHTGMFVNYFISSSKDFKEKNATRIFSVSTILGWLLAPLKIVLGSSIQNAYTFFGKDLVSDWVPEIPRATQIIKSLIMNIILVLGSLFIAPVTRTAGKYILEASKWTLYASYYYLFQESPVISSAIEAFKQMGVSNPFLLRFRYYRHKNSVNAKFFLENLFQIIKIHIKALEFRE
jgi:hypothetical protein